MPEMVTMEKLQEEILKRKMIEEKYYAEMENFLNIEIEVPQAIIEQEGNYFGFVDLRTLKNILREHYNLVF